MTPGIEIKTKKIKAINGEKGENYTKIKLKIHNETN